ncbi:uncharacterized oxidoreductase SERP2049-like [Bicyclus anynana]|uniref:Uncharacterized oxidoreductase SERP2049-like n=1 Tax=Bicyclus anynana TaxID=110368 RepID=A0A6J1NW95_BICAN|nr:uncharacterized oxidoreductase SERP2049-like [Bicyclus anynana]
MSFKGKVAIVTGSSSGIGAAVAMSLSAEGASVVIVGRNEAKLAATKAKCANALVVRADITIDADARRIVQQTIEKFGKIDILVNNAGNSILASIFDENIMESYDFTMNINLRAVFRMTSLVVPHIIKTKGNIVMISSVTGRSTSFGAQAISYAVSKAGLNHFGAYLAADLAPHGVRVNVISPGPVYTDLIENSGYDGSYDVLKFHTALDSVSHPQEIADLVLMVANDKAKSITGSNLFCDNGWMIKRY